MAGGSGVLSSGNFADLLEPVLRRVFDLAVSRPRPVMETLYGVESSTKFQEKYLGMGSMGLVPPFDGTVHYETFDAGYRTDIQNYEFATGLQIERSLVDDDQTGEISRRARTFAATVPLTIEHDAAQVFINAFTDSGTNRMGASVAGADAVGLCSTAHPLGPANTGNTQSNEGTLVLSIANLDTTRQNMRNWTDDKGLLLAVEPDTILVPSELERDAIKIVSQRATYEPDSAEFNVNMFSGQMRLIVWNRLTDANAWFVLDSGSMKNSLIWQWRIRPEFAQQEDFDGLLAKYRAYMRYGIGWVDWKFIYGQNPS